MFPISTPWSSGVVNGKTVTETWTYTSVQWWHFYWHFNISIKTRSDLLEDICTNFTVSRETCRPLPSSIALNLSENWHGFGFITRNLSDLCLRFAHFLTRNGLKPPRSCGDGGRHIALYSCPELISILWYSVDDCIMRACPPERFVLVMCGCVCLPA